jgi:5'-nucleotidase
MNILITNDDGIDSPGIYALALELSRVGNVLVVAPDRQQSGVGTSVSFLRENVTVSEVSSFPPGIRAYSVTGTPSDCVILGLRQLAQGHIDLLFSGINVGPNVGHDIPYSGTVMATLGGYFRKIPSIAVSLAIKNRMSTMNFYTAAKISASIAEGISKGTISTDAILNVNVPDIPPELIKGIKATRTADFGYVRIDDVRVLTDTTIVRNNQPSPEDNTDVWALEAGYISITPLRMEVTHHELIPTITRCMSTIKW